MATMNRSAITAKMKRLRLSHRAIERDAAGQPMRAKGLDPCLKSLFLLQSRRAREPASVGGYQDLHSSIYHALCASFLAYRAEHILSLADVADGNAAVMIHAQQVDRLQEVVTEHVQGTLSPPRYEIRALCGSQLSPTTFVRHEHILYVACRGSKTWHDWLADVQVKLEGIDDNEWLPGTGKVHAGFRRAFQAQVEAVLARIALEEDEDEQTEVVFCGHSLGGAVAQLLALAYSKSKGGTPDDHSARVVTFGSPRVGDAALGELLDVHTCHLRLFVAKDPVAGVPGDATRKLTGYTQGEYDDHTAKEHWALSLDQAAKSSSRRAPVVGSLVSEFGLHMTEHLITTYTNALIHHDGVSATERHWAARSGDL